MDEVINGKICFMKEWICMCHVIQGDHVNLKFARGTEIEDPYGIRGNREEDETFEDP